MQNIKITAPSDGFGIYGKVRAIGRCKKTGKIVSDTGWNSNLIMLGTDTGKSLILQRLAGTNTYSLNVTTLAIGTGTASPTVSDTGLQTETTRVTTPVASIVSNVLSLQFFFPDASLSNGTYYEVATFVDGAQIFNRALFGVAYVKTSGVDTTVQVDFTIT